MVWGNTGAGYSHFAAISASRNDGSANETNTPNGWGHCGTAALIRGTYTQNGVGSPWDGNSGGSPISASGWPCLDGLGRGQTLQTLNGQSFPNRLNSSTNSIAWPQQRMEPMYYWMNSMTVGNNDVIISDISASLNRDVFFDCGSANSACSGGFTGAAGTGFGTLANRPSTCTAGPGGTYGQSPTGSYGVAYWATDANSGNGELYVCTSTNTWTAVYQPYTYPHPLTAGATTGTAPQPPTNVSVTVQ